MKRPALPASLPASAGVLAALFSGSGLLHLVRPRTFEPLMPPWVPAHHEVIVGSGVVELLCAAGLLHPHTRRVAGWASAVVLVGVFPGNVHMAQQALAGDSTAYQAATLVRLPLQIPLIWAAVRAARSGS